MLKKPQTKQKSPLLLHLALLAEHLVKYPFIFNAERFLFQHGFISGMAWEGAECQGSRGEEAAPRWLHGSFSWGTAGRAGFVQALFRLQGRRWCWKVVLGSCEGQGWWGRLPVCLKTLCLLQTHQLDYSAHYLRLKFLIDNQFQFYVPKPEEEIYELVMLPTGQMEWLWAGRW